jgi:protein subunit release factor B
MFRAAVLRTKIARHGLSDLPMRFGAAATLTTSAMLLVKQMPSRPKPPPEEDIEEYFLKGSGPGGQKIVCTILFSTPFNLRIYTFANSCFYHQNKTSSAVQLRHKPTGLVVKSQATRSRIQNRKIARELLAAKLDEMQNGEASRSAIVGGVKKKRADSAAKKSRRKYRKLEEDKAATTLEGAEEEEIASDDRTEVLSESAESKTVT